MSIEQTEIFVAFFAGALALSIAAERIGVPAPMLLVIAGAVVHGVWHVQPGFDFGPALLFVFMPPLIFEGSWSIDLNAVRQRFSYVLYLSIPGTILTALLVALALSLSHILAPASALLFGAIVSATDPVAVISVFRRVNIPGTVKTIVEAESLTNDGIAVVLYGLALGLVLPDTGSSVAGWHEWIIRPVVQIGGGSLIGIAMALPTWLALRTTRSSEYEVAMTVVLAYASYLISQELHCSGIIATAASGIALRTLLRRTATLSHRDDVNVFWNATASLVNTFVFFTTGLLIEPSKLLESPLLVFMALVGMLGSRLALALTSAKSFRARMVVFLAGMRGSLPLALALSLPETIAHRSLIVNGVAASVILTLFINGAPLEATIRRLYRHHPNHDHHESQGAHHSHDQALQASSREAEHQ